MLRSALTGSATAMEIPLPLWTAATPPFPLATVVLCGLFDFIELSPVQNWRAASVETKALDSVRPATRVQAQWVESQPVAGNSVSDREFDEAKSPSGA